MVIRELITKLGFSFDPSAFNKYDRAIGEIHKKTESLGKNIEKIADGIGKAGKQMTFRLTLPIVGVGAASVMAAGEMEQMNVALGRFLGAGADVDDFVRRMWDVQRQSGMGIKPVQEATRTLFGLGLAADDVLDTMSMLANIAATGKIGLDELAYSYGRAMTRNKVESREVIRLQAAGLDLAEEMAAATGMHPDVMKKMIEEGKVEFKHLEAAFRRVTSEGGEFYNLAKDMDKTTVAAFVNIGNAIYRIRIAIGKIIIDTLKLDKAFQRVADTLERFAKWLKTIPKWLQTTLIIMAVVLAALGPLLIGLSSVLKTMVLIQLATGLVGKAALVAFGKMALALLPLTIKFALIAAAIGLILILIEDVAGYFQGRPSGLGLLVDFVKEMWGLWSDFWEDMGGRLYNFVQQLTSDWTTFWEDMGGRLANFVGDVQSAINRIAGWIRGVPVIGALYRGAEHLTEGAELMRGRLEPDLSGMMPAMPGGGGIVLNLHSNYEFHGTGTPEDRKQWKEQAEIHAEEMSMVFIKDLERSIRR